MAVRLLATNVTRGVTLAENGRVADSIWGRLVGLLRDKELAEGDGLWIVPCNSIHSFAMRFAFDAVFLDHDLRIIHLMGEMKPWRISPIKFAAHSVLELPAGVIAQSGSRLGDQLEMRREG
jgi:uncharacterized membrane protein (UPF0127 family)